MERDGGIATFPCESLREQMFEMLEKQKGCFSLQNKKSGKCIDVGGTDGRGDIGMQLIYDHDCWRVI
jgi:hypothetical protein